MKRPVPEVDAVMRLVAEQLRVQPSELWPERRFVEDLAAGDVELTNLLLALEERFDIQIRAEDAAQLRSLSAVLRYIDQRLGPARGS
jgi:acyl carrier protein